eukprot:IDg763t1
MMSHSGIDLPRGFADAKTRKHISLYLHYVAWAHAACMRQLESTWHCWGCINNTGEAVLSQRRNNAHGACGAFGTPGTACPGAGYTHPVPDDNAMQSGAQSGTVGQS